MTTRDPEHETQTQATDTPAEEPAQTADAARDDEAAPEQDAEIAVPNEHGSWQSALWGAALYLAFFAGMTLFNNLSPQLPPAVWAIIAPITTVAYTLILVYTIRLLCRMSLTTQQEALFMVSALFLFLVLNPVAHDIVWNLVTGKPIDQILSSLREQELPPVLAVAVPFLLILTGVFAGQLLSRIIREAAMLVPVSIIAGLIDFWGVYWGPVGDWSEQAPAAVNSMATAATAAASVPEAVRTQLPEQLRIFGNIAPPDNIGIGDFVFLAFFLTCAYRLGFSARRTMWGIFGGLLLASLVFALDGTSVFGYRIDIAYLPGLLFICGGVLVANLGFWRLSRVEWAMTGVLAAVLLGLIGLFIARAEQAKPKIENVSFAINAVSHQELLENALRRAEGEVPRETAMLPLVGLFEYAVDKGTPSLQRWRVLALARSPRPGLRRTYDISVEAMRLEDERDQWLVSVTTSTPPEIAISLLRKNDKDDALDLIRQARALPPGAFALVDEVETLRPESQHRILTLQIAPRRAVVLGGRNTVLKTYNMLTYGRR